MGKETGRRAAGRPQRSRCQGKGVDACPGGTGDPRGGLKEGRDTIPLARGGDDGSNGGIHGGGGAGARPADRLEMLRLG